MFDDDRTSRPKFELMQFFTSRTPTPNFLVAWMMIGLSKQNQFQVFEKPETTGFEDADVTFAPDIQTVEIPPDQLSQNSSNYIDNMPDEVSQVLSLIFLFSLKLLLPFKMSTNPLICLKTYLVY